jgi:hypothetical protein
VTGFFPHARLMEINSFGESLRMATYSHLAAKLLRDAATFFRNVGAQNQPLKEQMDDNASVYEQVADLVENDPMGELDLGDEEAAAKK